jgi:hypothetical protein
MWAGIPNNGLLVGSPCPTMDSIMTHVYPTMESILGRKDLEVGVSNNVDYRQITFDSEREDPLRGSFK